DSNEVPRRMSVHAGESLAMDGNHVFARIGTAQHPASHLICLECDRHAEKFHWHLRWKIQATELAGPGPGDVRFDGCPLIDGDRLICTWSRIVGDRATVGAAAFSLNGLERGPLWKRTIAELDGGRRDFTPVPLVRAGPNVIVPSVGMITAFD